MTEDLLQNVSQPGRNHSFPSHKRLALDGNKEELKNLEVWKGDSIGGVKHQKRVFGQDETKMRLCYDPSRDLARGVKSEAGEKDAQMGASPHVLAQFGQRDLFRGLKCRLEEMSNLQLQDPCEIYEPGGRGEGDELGDSKKGEAKMSAVCKSQETAAARQLRQSPQGCQQYLQQGASGELHSFLPQKNLRILLVEDDDSTRHVVSALLRNCGYEVTSVESTVQAWEALQDRSCHFDLALTEIMLPSLAGIGLLARMKNQESCRQIPVVMMSSLDSMDIVFKCLSKGAVDFLVKPVRKNELNNLWQHVWRKCQSSSGSGSGSESQTGKVAGMKDINDMTNNSESNGNEGNSLNLGGDSDNGSGTQSFWTKRGVEVDSTHRPAEWDVTRHPPGALAHADDRKNSPVPPEDSSLSVDAVRVKSQPKDTEHVIGKNLEIAARKIGALEIQVAKSGHLKDADQSVHIMPMQDVEQYKPPIDKGIQDVSERVVSGTKVVSLLANIGCQSKNKENPHRSKDGEMLDRGASNSFDTKDNISGPRLLPALELTLKRSSTSAEHDKVESRHVLRQSGISAFSRYSNSRGALQQHPPVCSVGSFTLTSFPLQGSEVSTLLSLNAQISSGYNNQEMTPSMVGCGLVQAAKEEAAFASGVPMSIALPSSAMVSFNGASVFSPSRHPVFYTHSSKFPWAVAAHLTDQDGHAYQKFEDYDFPLQQVYHHHSHHHHHHQRHHHLDAHKDPGSPKSSEEEQTVTDLGSGPPLCGSSNTIQIVSSNHNVSGSSNGYGVNGNGSVNGSTSGSINRNGNSNGQSGVMANAGLIGESGNNNGNSASGIGHGISSVNGGNGSMAIVGPEQYCFTRRDAALNKFRQKRKERCFDKKVRYQSRKRLAEQRPRVRGQFVRQVAKFPADADKEHGKVEYTFADTNVDFVDAEHDISQCRPS